MNNMELTDDQVQQMNSICTRQANIRMEIILLGFEGTTFYLHQLGERLVQLKRESTDFFNNNVWTLIQPIVGTIPTTRYSASIPNRDDIFLSGVQYECRKTFMQQVTILKIYQKLKATRT